MTPEKIFKQFEKTRIRVIGDGDNRTWEELYRLECDVRKLLLDEEVIVE